MKISDLTPQAGDTITFGKGKYYDHPLFPTYDFIYHAVGSWHVDENNIPIDGELFLFNRRKIKNENI